MSSEYIYQYDLDGFPIAKAMDIARRMRFHKKKLYKKCPVCEENETLNKTNHRCLDCLINLYAYNMQITDFFPMEIAK